MVGEGRVLPHGIPAREVHPVEDLKVLVLADPLQRGRPAWVDLDPAGRAGLGIAALGTGAALRPWRADAADEPEPGIEGRRQMPQFNLNDDEYQNLADFLLWVDTIDAQDWPPNDAG